jgi:ribose transport system ATP-binding protein
MNAGATGGPPGQGDPRRAVDLAVRGLSKTFGATRALVDVSFDVSAGTIHGLLGGNGSGKSTLIKVLAGVHHAEPGGSVAILGAPEVGVQDLSPDFARRSGMRFVHQDLALFPELTVADNIAIGAGFPRRGPQISAGALRARTQSLLDRYEISARPHDRIGALRQSTRTMIAIVRALQDVGTATRRLLVLDEPTAALPPHEVDVLLAALRNLAEDGQTIVYVSHRIDEILDLTDAVTVLRDGAHVITRPTRGMAGEHLIEYIVGKPLAAFPGSSPRVPAAAEPLSPESQRVPALTVTSLAGGPIAGVSFEVMAGETVGIAGLLGSGRTEMLRMIFGAYPVTAGEIFVQGREYRPGSPGEAMQAGIAHLPEERGRDAVFMDRSVLENLTITSLPRFGPWFRVSRRKERRWSAEVVRKFRIRCRNESAPMTSLSGGNQQKVVLARWIERRPCVLLLDEPTQGIDVGSRAEIYRLILSAKDEGMATVVVSSDLDELAEVSDRVLVLRKGVIAAEAHGPDLTPRRLTELVYITEEQS